MLLSLPGLVKPYQVGMTPRDTVEEVLYGADLMLAEAVLGEELEGNVTQDPSVARDGFRQPDRPELPPADLLEEPVARYLGEVRTSRGRRRVAGKRAPGFPATHLPSRTSKVDTENQNNTTERGD
jgi:hypothetical protein